MLFLLTLTGYTITAVSCGIPFPEWPRDFQWSLSGRPQGYDCVQIRELAEPTHHTWKDNFFCWKKGTKHPGIKWYWAGPIRGMRCTQILEKSDPHTWTDNYLCVPPSSPLNFIWSSSGPLEHHKCIRWYESRDPDGWGDNYLCEKGCRVTEAEVVKDELIGSGLVTGTQALGGVFGGSCYGAFEDNNLSLMSLEDVQETMSVKFLDEDVNWPISKSIKLTSTANMFLSHKNVLSLDLDLGSDGQYSNSWTKQFKGRGHETMYRTPGAAIILGLVNKHETDINNVSVKMHFRCDSGEEFVSYSNATIQTTMFHGFRFESMVGRYHTNACRADPSIGECMPDELRFSHNNYFGNISSIRTSFAKCFEGGKGAVFSSSQKI